MKFEKGKIYRAFSNQPGLHKLTMASAEFSKVARKAKAPVVIVQHLPDFQAGFEFTVEENTPENKVHKALLAAEKKAKLYLTVLHA